MPPPFPHPLRQSPCLATCSGILVRALQENHFNRTATAARLGISLRQIRYRIARLNISAPGDNHADEDA